MIWNSMTQNGVFFIIKIHERENADFEVVSPALSCTKTPSIMLVWEQMWSRVKFVLKAST